MAVDLSIPNSVIAAFQAGSQERRQREQTAFENKLQLEANKRANEQMEAAIKQSQQAHELAQAHLKLSQQEFEHKIRSYVGEQIEKQNMQIPQTTIGQPQESYSMPGTRQLGPVFPGMNPAAITVPTSQDVTTPPPYKVPTPGGAINYMGMDIPTDQFVRPEDRRAAQMDFLKQELKAQTEAHIAQAQGVHPLKMEEIGATAAGRANVANIQAGQRMAAAQLTATQRHLDNQAHVAAMYGVAKIKAENQVNPEEVAALARDATMGRAKLTTNKQSMAARAAIQAMDRVPFDENQRAALLKVHDLDPIIQDMKEMVTQYSSPTKLGMIGTVLRSKIPDDKIRRLTDRLREYAGNVARVVGAKTGRITEPDIQRAIKILTDPSMTTDSANTALTKFQRDMATKTSRSILGDIQNPKQMFDILEAEKFDPSIYGGTVRVGGKDVPYFQQSPQTGKWGYVDTKLGKVVALPTSED